MDLQYRLANNSDLKACEVIYRKSFASYDQKLTAALPSIWAEVIKYSPASGIPLIIEDHHRDPGHRIVAFAFSAFVSDPLLQELKCATATNFSYSFSSIILNSKCPLLEPTAVANANASDGLNLVVTGHARVLDHGEDDVGPYIRERLTAAFLEMHAGNNIKEVLAECFHKDLAWATRCGFRVRSQSYFNGPKANRHDADLGPFIVGLTREEAKKTEGTLASFLFLYNPPRFRFKSHEQQLLREAIEGKTDEEVSMTLNVGLSTVKKRWSTIYERVIEVDDSVIPDTQMDNSTKRGAEKRRRLITYLRRHPEELRALASKK